MRRDNVDTALSVRYTKGAQQMATLTVITINTVSSTYKASSGEDGLTPLASSESPTLTPIGRL